MAPTNNQSRQRFNFGKIKHGADYPDFLEIQLQSFEEFFQLETTPENRINEGLYQVFKENFPIEHFAFIEEYENEKKETHKVLRKKKKQLAADVNAMQK